MCGTVLAWCVFACQDAGNAAATSPARGGGCLAASSPADACAPFGFGFAESSLRKLRFLRRISRQSPDCRRGRVHRHASRRPKRVRLKAAAFPAQHIRSALSQGMAGGAAHVDACAPFGFGFAESALRFAPAHFRLRRIPAGRRVQMRRGLPSPGSVGIPPVAGSAASRLPPSASPAVTASASCRRPSSPLRFSVARMIMRVKITRRVCRAGSGGGLPVFRDARHEPRQTVR